MGVMRGGRLREDKMTEIEPLVSRSQSITSYISDADSVRSRTHARAHNSTQCTPQHKQTHAASLPLTCTCANLLLLSQPPPPPPFHPLPPHVCSQRVTGLTGTTNITSTTTAWTPAGPLISASRDGNLAEVRKLLESGEDLDVADLVSSSSF